MFSGLVGQAITAVRISEPEYSQGRPRPGISGGSRAYFRAFLLLDSGQVIELGTDSRGDPPLLHPTLEAVGRPLQCPLEPLDAIVGKTFTGVLQSSGIPFIEVDERDVVWVGDDLYGTEITFEPKDESDFDDFRPM